MPLLGHPAGQNPPRNDAITPRRPRSVGCQRNGRGGHRPRGGHDCRCRSGNRRHSVARLNQSQRNAVFPLLESSPVDCLGTAGDRKKNHHWLPRSSWLGYWRRENMGQNLRMLVTGPTYTAWEKLFRRNPRAFWSAARISREYRATGFIPLHMPTEVRCLQQANAVLDIEAKSIDPGFQTLWSELENPGNHSPGRDRRSSVFPV